MRNSPAVANKNQLFLEKDQPLKVELLGVGCLVLSRRPADNGHELGPLAHGKDGNCR